jgi:hypothetical protein
MAVAIPLMAIFLLSPAGPAFLLGFSALSLAAIGL